MRIILDVDTLSDAQKALSLALEQQRLDEGGDFGYWSNADPDFSAYIRTTKAGVSVRARRWAHKEPRCLKPSPCVLQLPFTTAMGPYGARKVGSCVSVVSLRARSTRPASPNIPALLRQARQHVMHLFSCSAAAQAGWRQGMSRSVQLRSIAR